MTPTIRLDSNGYSENVANKFLGFQNPIDFTINSGTGSAIQEDSNIYGFSSVKIFKGNLSLKVSNLDYNNNNLVFSSPSSNYSFTTDTPFNYFVSTFFMLPSGTINTTYKLEIFEDGVLFNTLVFDLNSDTIPQTENFYRFGQNVRFDSGYTYTFRRTLVKDATHPTNNIVLYEDGFAIQCLNKGSQEETTYQLPKDLELFNSQTIDVPSIASNNYAVVTATLTGALVGDFVQITYPNELITLGLIVGNPIISNTDEVSFIIHNHSGGSLNPESGTYSFKIIR